MQIKGPKADYMLDQPTSGELCERRGQGRPGDGLRIGKLKEVNVGSHVIYRGAQPNACQLAKSLSLIVDGVHGQMMTPIVDRRLRVKWFPMHEDPNGT